MTERSRKAATRSSFPFSCSASTGSTSTASCTRRNAGVPDQNFAGRGSLLEARRDVHRVTGDEPLSGGRVAGNHLARVHPDPRREPLAVLAFEVLVQGRQRGPHLGGGANRAKRIVFVEPRDPEDGHDGVADELLDGPPCDVDHGRHLVEEAAHDATERLGIEPLTEAVDPPTSAKTIVTTFRTSAEAVSAPPSGVAQCWQKRARSAFSSLQLGHRFTAGA